MALAGRPKKQLTPVVQEVEVKELIEEVAQEDPKLVPEEIVQSSLKQIEELPKESFSMAMDQDGLFQSMKNAIMILPPNLKVDGRHTIENISAICGYKVTEDLWNKLYEDQ